jgi:exonuclease SbcC
MIITHISAENVLKYKQLQLDNIPRAGLITISGQNESGKSTIGETVCFALFGRTFSLAKDEIRRVIRWGEERCSVRLGFSVSGLDYEIARFLDNEGNHGARLYLAGEEETPVAKGLSAVNEALYDLLGYQFDEFVESFYLAQREITTPHPHSHAIKTMAGIAALESVADELEFEVKYEKSRMPALAEQIENVEEDLQALEIDPDRLKELESQHEIIRQAGETLQQCDEGLANAASDYALASSQIRSASTMKIISGLLAIVSLLAALATGVSWFLFNKLPDSTYTQQLSAIVEQYLPGWSEQSALYLSKLAPATGVLSIIFLLFWLLSHTMKKKISALRDNGEALAQQLLITQQPVPGLGDEITTVSSDETDDTNETDETSETFETDETDVTKSAVLQAEPESIVPGDESPVGNTSAMELISSDLSAIRRCKLDMDRTNKLVEERQVLIEDKKITQQDSQGSIEFLISQEQNRRDKAESLDNMLGDLQEKMDEHQHRIRVREMADELIDTASQHFSQRFNKDLRELASGTLPLFTEGRYEHLHIDNDLNVSAFSSLKRDYMDLDEISSGTQRQIMLAVRLALSQELVNTTGGGKQFIFLDEPFAFFDDARTRNAMAILPELSEEIRQVWVIAQSFPEDTKHDLNIVCSREYESLPPEES